MRRVLCVSMPRSGHHVLEGMLQQSLGTQFSYCEFYTEQNCCKRIPCVGRALNTTQDCLLFLQKSHDHNLRDPSGSQLGDTIVQIQVREPVARALSNYELDLNSNNIVHSYAYMSYWLGSEAAYTCGFIDKWCSYTENRPKIFYYEDMINNPSGYFRAILSDQGLPVDILSQKFLSRQLKINSDGKSLFKKRDITSSKYYDDKLLSDFHYLVAEKSRKLGYHRPDGVGRGNVNEEMMLIFHAKTFIFSEKYEEALSLLKRYAVLSNAHVASKVLEADVLIRMGKLADAEIILDSALKKDSQFTAAYISLAHLALLRGRPEEAILMLETCLSNAVEPAKSYKNIRAVLGNNSALSNFFERRAAPTTITQQDVVLAFRFILGREPEDQASILAHLNADSLAALRRSLLLSAEFQDAYGRLTGD